MIRMYMHFDCADLAYATQSGKISHSLTKDARPLKSRNNLDLTYRRRIYSNNNRPYSNKSPCPDLKIKPMVMYTI